MTHIRIPVGQRKTENGKEYELKEQTTGKPRWNSVDKIRQLFRPPQKAMDGAPQIRAKVTFKPERPADKHLDELAQDNPRPNKPASYQVTLANPRDHNIFSAKIIGRGATEEEAMEQFREAVKQNKLSGEIVLEKSLRKGVSFGAVGIASGAVASSNLFRRQPSAGGLFGRGNERPNHKYKRRELTSNGYRYYYEDDRGHEYEGDEQGNKIPVDFGWSMGDVVQRKDIDEGGKKHKITDVSKHGEITSYEDETGQKHGASSHRLRNLSHEERQKGIKVLDTEYAGEGKIQRMFRKMFKKTQLGLFGDEPQIGDTKTEDGETYTLTEQTVGKPRWIKTSKAETKEKKYGAGVEHSISDNSIPRELAEKLSETEHAKIENLYKAWQEAKGKGNSTATYYAKESYQDFVWKARMRIERQQPAKQGGYAVSPIKKIEPVDVSSPEKLRQAIMQEKNLSSSDLSSSGLSREEIKKLFEERDVTKKARETKYQGGVTVAEFWDKAIKEGFTKLERKGINYVAVNRDGDTMPISKVALEYFRAKTAGMKDEPQDDIKTLEKKYRDMSVEELIKLKKKLYSNMDIESPKSPEEKLLDTVLSQKQSDLNQQVMERHKQKQEERRKQEDEAEAQRELELEQEYERNAEKEYKKAEGKKKPIMTIPTKRTPLRNKR